MPVPQPKTLRRALLAGAVVLALCGAGPAMVRAAEETAGRGDADPQLVASQPTATPPAPGDQGKAEEAKKGQGKGRELHSESVVKKGDGSLETRITQFGTVESVSDTSITVKSEDGYTLAYAISADTKIRKRPAAAADGTPPSEGTAPAPQDDAGKRVKPSAATAADLKQGDTVRIRGIKNGTSISATAIVEGAAAKGKGLGQGKGAGQAQGQGQGQRQGKGLGQGKAKGEGQGQADDAP
ncbi:hypothetical protein J2809_001498 [Arthrobacter pascens]|uniref:hypothetical protein n=1 Tax=Arthrobacter pascens TaxID=1677 RepID=UPI00285A362D|nr:hypothetical protein [Arthrobacter pascens]MDR6557147.1 hypothetical protein [Arthrobacter pascens]